MAGSGMQRTLLLCTTAEQEDALATLATHGARYQAMLVGSAVAGEAPDVLSCPVATMRNPFGGALDVSDDSSLVPVFQLLGEAAPELSDEADWVAALQLQQLPNAVAAVDGVPCTSQRTATRRSVAFHEIVTTAFNSAITDSRCGEAVRTIAELSDAQVREYPLVLRLCRTLRRAAAAALAHGVSVARALALDDEVARAAAPSLAAAHSDSSGQRR
mmetsp:Transcript_22980/g.71288  ORF Transcript_22980/g.71288 Transcript_22980/m.71288 type:complete len:216 (-) Transcript_22980:358-1005(-)